MNEQKLTYIPTVGMSREEWLRHRRNSIAHVTKRRHRTSRNKPLQKTSP